MHLRNENEGWWPAFLRQLAISDKEGHKKQLCIWGDLNNKINWDYEVPYDVWVTIMSEVLNESRGS